METQCEMERESRQGGNLDFGVRGWNRLMVRTFP